MRKISFIIFCFLLAFANSSHAQKTPNTLLWKISGNGLSKPSYLYGTMHLTDERIFNLGDSLYEAIENTDGFAIEIDPEFFTAIIIDEAKKSIQRGRLLKDMLNEKTFQRYGKGLAKKLNKDENEITTTDVLREKNKWVEESYRTGKMQTFLDAYLFDIARRQGKWTGGVEDAEDQMGALDYLIDESDIQQLSADDKKSGGNDLTTEQLIKFYTSNDLNAIDSISSLSDSLYHDALLGKRNIKMAMRMDSMGHVRSMVFAVGAAHLPGDDGIIALLKSKGFTVAPVFSSKKIKPKDYKVAEIELPWHDVTDENGFYAASMPGKAGDMNMYGIVNMKMYFDIFNSTLYMSTAIQTPYSKSMVDSVMSLMSGYYFATDDYKKGKAITINDVQGREFTSSKEHYSHGYLLYGNGIMYIAIGMSIKQDSAAAPSINRFLKSFTIKQATRSTNFYTYTDVSKGFTVELPAKPKPYTELGSLNTDSTINRELNIVADPVSGAYIFVGVSEAARGYFIENDSSTLQGIKTTQSAKLSAIKIDTTYIKNNHRVMEFGGTMNDAPLTMKGYYECRGNRWYSLLAIYDPAKPNRVVDHFFNSFRILDYPPALWHSFSTGDRQFSTWSPSAFSFSNIRSYNAFDTSYRYESYDSIRADNFAVVMENLSRYYWQQNDSTLWKELIDNATDYNDSIISKKTISNGDAKGYELLLWQQGAGNYHRKRILLNGNKIYTLSTSQALTEIYKENNNRFFEDFRFANYRPSDDIFVSKAALLLKDLADKDSLVSAEAKTYLRSAKFSEAELDLLHNALLKDYTGEDESYNSSKKAIQNAIIHLKEDTSLSFAKNNYLTASEEDKIILLGIMAAFRNETNYKEIKDLLLNHTPKKAPDYTFTNNFSDSAALAAIVFPDLLPLLKDTSWAASITRIANTLNDSGLLPLQVLQPYQPNLLQLAQRNYDKSKKDKEYYDYSNNSLIALLTKMNNAGSNQMLQKWSMLKSNYLQLEALSGLLRNKQAVNPQALLTSAEDKYSRTDLYDTLKAYRKTALFPKQYLTQKLFAESYAYVAASDDDDPSAITFIIQKTMKLNGHDAKFYFFKITYGEDEDASYSLACAGPFDINASVITSDDTTGDIYYDEDFDPSNLPAQMEALIKQMEDWMKDKDDDPQ